MDEFIYKGDNNILYKILINFPNENILTLSFSRKDAETENDIYESTIFIDDLKKNFVKVIKYKNLYELKNNLIENINEF